MLFKRRVFVLIVLGICICALFGFGRNITHNRITKCSEAACNLLPYFSDIYFDGITYDDATNNVCIYEYVKTADSSNVLVRRPKKIISLETDKFEDLSLFKNVKWCCGGLFFASSIGWDGEWSGIYINLSGLPTDLLTYVDCEIKFGHYWLSGVPHHILIK